MGEKKKEKKKKNRRNDLSTGNLDSWSFHKYCFPNKVPLDGF